MSFAPEIRTMALVGRERWKTPWGTPDFVTAVRGPTDDEIRLILVETPSHGGMLPCREIFDRIPSEQRSYAARWSGVNSDRIAWFEHDVCWAFVALAAPELFDDETLTAAANIVAHWRTHWSGRTANGG